MTTALVHYDAACKALAEARTVDEVIGVRDEAERLRLYGRQAKNRDLIADATEIMQRAERRLGQLLALAKAAGQIAEGRPKNCPESEQFPRLTYDEIGIDRKLAAVSQRIAQLPQAAFDAMLQDTRERIIAKGAQLLNPITTAEKQHARSEREVETGAKIQALPTQKFGVILADPEWKFETWSERGMNRSAENHYSTTATQIIASRDVPSIAADDCVLLLWAVPAMLLDALQVMKAWDFIYKTHAVWAKERFTKGFWFRGRHELWLLGTRGNPVCPAEGEQFPSLLRPRDPPRADHSRKPTLFRKIIETHWPNTPKIELNAADDEEWPGWTRWGAPHRSAAE